QRGQHAGRSGNALAAFEVEPARVVVAKDHSQAGDAQILGLLRACLERLDHGIHQPRASGETFQAVKHKNENPGRFAENAEHIRRSDVPAAHGAYVHPFGARHEITRGNRTENIGRNDDGEVADTARKIAQKYRVQAFNSLAEAAAASDGLSIVTPTTIHYELAKLLLQQGKHVLVEKPMTDNAAQAAELVQFSQQNHCVLQVGHVERFNPVLR